MRKAWFYIKKLHEKGWTDEQIIAKTHFHAGRYERLKQVGTIPTQKEVHKLRSMLILSPEAKRKSALDIWNQPRGPVTEVEEAPRPEPKAVFTDKQLAVLRELAKGETVLTKNKAIIASHLRKNGLIETRLNDEKRRVYKLSESGQVVADGITSSSS